MQRISFHSLVIFFSMGLFSSARALPADSLHLRYGGPDGSPWGAAAFYHFAPVDGALGIRADLGFQLSRYFGEAKRSALLLHVQADSLLLGYSEVRAKLFALPLRWTLGVDLNSPFSYLGETQIYFPLGRFEPFASLRIQSTGFSVVGGDGPLFEAGAVSRFWLGAIALGASYPLHPDLRVGTSFTYRASFSNSKLKDPGVFHMSMQWLWGAGDQ